MSWRNVKLILLREVRDQLRDRRTLFMIAVLPLLLYPAMGIGMMQMTVLFAEQPRTVVILGVEHLPKSPPLLEDDSRFVSTLFSLPSDADTLRVVTDRSEEASGGETDEARAELLAQARRIQQKFEERLRLEQVRDEADAAGDHLRAGHLRERVRQLNRELAHALSQADIQVLIIVPQGFAERIEEVNRALADRKLDAQHLPPTPRPLIVNNRADEKSAIAFKRVEEALASWEDAILQQRLEQADLPRDISKPVNPNPVDLAEREQLSANLWSKLFPALLVIMAVTGAFYPAVDLAAGEKERGTMETLLICPASRSEIVVGKFFTVMLFSISTAVLNLASMGLTGKYIASMGGEMQLSRIGDVAFPPLSAMIWLVVLLVPLAALFSAVCLALATFARSSKEGQYYLTPVLMVTLGITIFCLSPAVEITPFYSILPVMNVALLLKQALLAEPGGSSQITLYAVPVLATSVIYSLLALWWAVEQFRREDVLFREAERFDLRLWVKHLLRDKEPTPSFVEAGFCFVMIMLLQFGALKFFGQALQTTGQADYPRRMMQLLIVQQLAIVLCPALFMGVILTTSVRDTFRLRLPSWKMLAAALALPFALNPLTTELVHSLAWFFPRVQRLEVVANVMSARDQPLWLVLLTFSLAPGICEEVTFRGFILSGFGRSRRMWLAVVLSALTFGIMHMIPQQVFNATLLGLVLGLLAVRSRSLLPPVLFHMIYNGMEVLKARYAHTVGLEGPAGWLFLRDGGQLRFTWFSLCLAGIAAIVLLRWLVREGGSVRAARPASSPLKAQAPDDSALVVS